MASLRLFSIAVAATMASPVRKAVNPLAYTIIMVYIYGMRTTLIIADDKYEKIRKIATLRRKSMAQIINEAIDESLISAQHSGLKSLKGILKGANFTTSDIEQAKLKIRGFS